MAHHHHNHTNVSEYSSKFKLGIALNIAFVVLELAFGLIYSSLALIADAGHNLTDVAGLAIAWLASYLTLRKPTKHFTYGLKKSPIIGAQLNSLLLLVAIGIIIWEAINRLNNPVEVKGTILIIIAGIGVIINGLTTYLFHSGKDKDINIKGAYLHMLADTMISLGVVFSGIIIHLTDAVWIDPVISIIIALVIFWGTWQLLQEATKLSLDGVPPNVNVDEVMKYFAEHKDIKDYHHLHIWALSTTETALTVHLVSQSTVKNDDLINSIIHELEHSFNIHHATIQIESVNCSSGC